MKRLNARRGFSLPVLVVVGGGVVVLVTIVSCRLVAGIEDFELTPGAADGGGSSSGSSGTVGEGGPVGIDKSGVSISDTLVDFGLVECGGPPPPNKTLTLKNNATVTRSWTATISTEPNTPSIEVVSGGSGALEPGASATITLVAPTLPATLAAGVPYRKLLSLTIDDPQRSKIALPVVMTSGGAQFTLPANQLGSIPTDTVSSDIPLKLYNTGNMPATVTLGTPTGAGFVVSWTGAPAPVVLQPNTAMPGLIARFDRMTGSASSASVPVQAVGPVCGKSPTQPLTFSLSGGSTSTIGNQPGALDFGRVACGAQATPQTITFTNFGSAVTWTATLNKGANSLFTIGPSTSGSLARDASVALTITPKPIPSALSAIDAGGAASPSTAVGDALSFDYSSGPGTVKRTVELRQFAVGGILTLDRQQLDFGASAVGAQAVQTFRVTNTGSRIGINFAPVGAFGVLPSGTSVAAGSLFAAFLPTAPGPSTGTLVATTSDPLCAPLPPIGVAGSGQ